MIMGAEVEPELGRDEHHIVGRRGGPSAVDHDGVELETAHERGLPIGVEAELVGSDSDRLGADFARDCRVARHLGVEDHAAGDDVEPRREASRDREFGAAAAHRPDLAKYVRRIIAEIGTAEVEHAGDDLDPPGDGEARPGVLLLGDDRLERRIAVGGIGRRRPALLQAARVTGIDGRRLAEVGGRGRVIEPGVRAQRARPVRRAPR